MIRPSTFKMDFLSSGQFLSLKDLHRVIQVPMSQLKKLQTISVSKLLPTILAFAMLICSNRILWIEKPAIEERPSRRHQTECFFYFHGYFSRYVFAFLGN